MRTGIRAVVGDLDDTLPPAELTCPTALQVRTLGSTDQDAG